MFVEIKNIFDMNYLSFIKESMQVKQENPFKALMRII